MRSKGFCFCVLLCGLALLSAQATVRHVPGDHATIQGGIDAAVDGDTVLVAPGTYLENIGFRGKHIVVASEYLMTHNPALIATTIIDGSQPASADTASVVRMLGGEDSTTVLAGFTLTGGTGTPLVDQINHSRYVEGGGILIEAASPVIRHNIIRDNIVQRTPTGIASAGGGGLRCGFGNPRILGNVFVHNDGRYYGGGIVVNYANATIRNNVVVNNTGGQTFGGGGLWIYGTGYTSVVENNTVCGNTSGQTGGGIRVWVTDVVGRNNIVWENNANSGSDQIAGAAADAVFTYSDIQGGRAGTGNLDVPPQFADANLALLPASPLIDAGDPDPVYNDGNGSRNDIGAYGGPGATEFPLFTQPLISLLTPVINFGVGGPGVPRHKNLIIGNFGGSVLVIDSVRFVGDAASIVTLAHALTAVRPFGRDTVDIVWTAAAMVPLADTLLIYHNDPASPNPARVALAGLVSGVSVPEPRGALPQAFRLAGNYPNPFNASTVIRFELPVSSEVRVEIFDLLGRSVALLESGSLAPGAYTLPWAPTTLASGTYICRLQAGDFRAEQTLTLLR